MPILLQLAQSYSNPDSVNYKIAYLREKIGDADFGKLAYADQVQLAMLGDTIVVGGFLKTELIAAKSIYSEHLASGAVTADKLAAGSVTADKMTVTDLSAITGHFSNLYAGNYPDGAYMQFFESDGNPFIDFFDETERRVRHEKDRICWFRGGSERAYMIVGDSPEGGTSHFLSLLTETTYGGVLLGAIKGTERTYVWINRDDQFARIQSTNGVMFTLSGPNEQATWQNCWTYHWGDFHIDNNLVVSGSISKGSGTFLIDHPLDPDNKNLVHGFIEGPRYDLLYRGEAKLANGQAEIDIDQASNMTPGTFSALTQNAQVVSLCNLTGYPRLMPSDIEDGKFTVTCEDKFSSDTFSWVVLAERADPFILNDKYTDKDGRLIPEHEKETLSEIAKIPNIKNVDNKQKYAGFKGYKRHYEAYEKLKSEGPTIER